MPLSQLLRLNAAFTSVCAIALLLANDIIAMHVPLPPSWLLLLGFALLAYVPLLLLTSFRLTIPLLKLVVALDFGYVVLAGIATIWLRGGLDDIGWLLLVGSTAIVAIFALLQMRPIASGVLTK